MNLLKYKSENDFSKNGWKILTFSTFKVHVNKDRNIKEIYTSNSIFDRDKIELDELFESKLKFITPMLLDIGIDFHALAEKKIEKCFFTITETLPFEYTILKFNFFGKLSGESVNAEIKQNIELSETYNNIEYKVSFGKVQSDNENLLLTIKIKEILKKANY